MKAADLDRVIAAAFRAFEKAGTPVKAARVYLDGSIGLLTDVAEETLPAVVETSWVDCAGEKTVGRA